MYIKEILFYLTFPAIIVVSWYLALYALKKFEAKRLKDEGLDGEGQ